MEDAGLCRRVRRLYGIGQQQLAELLGVTQGSVSRYERGVIGLATDIRRQLQIMAAEHDPTISPAYIERLPTMSCLMKRHDPLYAIAMSPGLAETLNLTAEQGRGLNVRWLVGDNVRRLADRMVQHRNYRNMAFAELVYRNTKGIPTRTVVVPVNDHLVRADGAFLFCGNCQRSGQPRFEESLKVVPLDAVMG